MDLARKSQALALIKKGTSRSLTSCCKLASKQRRKDLTCSNKEVSLHSHLIVDIANYFLLFLHQDHKKIVIPSFEKALDFERVMQTKLAVLAAVFFSKQKPQDQQTVNLEVLIKQSILEHSSSVRMPPQLPSDRVLCAMGKSPEVYQIKLDELTSLFKDVAYGALVADHPLTQLFWDRQQDKLRQTLLRSGIEVARRQGEQHAPSITLMLHVGQATGNPIDLLVASRLQREHSADVSLCLKHLCEEEFKENQSTLINYRL